MAIFKTLGHLALRVHDLDASAAFCNKIGFPEMLRPLDDKGASWSVHRRITNAYCRSNRLERGGGAD